MRAPRLPDALARLNLPPGAHVLVIATTTFDEDGAPLAYEVELHPPAARITLDLITL